MAGLKCFLFSTCVLLSLTINCTMASSCPSQAVKGAYWPSWSFSNFPPSAIDTTLFTHVYYAFLSPNNVTFQFDIDNSTALMLVNFTSTLRYAKNPPVKTLFSIGGAAEGSVLFARMASSRSSRKNFILSSIEVARKFGFDGIDFDWEHPESPKEMEDLGVLLDEWRAEVQKEAVATSRPQLLLTEAVYYSVEFMYGVYRKYPVASINKNLDWINAMCYDYHGNWNTSETGSHAALFDSKTNLSTSYGLLSWMKAGLSTSKLIMGLPLYGKTWQLKDPLVHGVGAPAINVGPGDNGIMSYAEVEEFNRQNSAIVTYDVETLSPYSVVGTSWIGYDDVRSISVRIGYAQVLGLRGYFFWAVDGDHEWKISRTASKFWIFEN